MIPVKRHSTSFQKSPRSLVALCFLWKSLNHSRNSSWGQAESRLYEKVDGEGREFPPGYLALFLGNISHKRQEQVAGGRHAELRGLTSPRSAPHNAAPRPCYHHHSLGYCCRPGFLPPGEEHYSSSAPKGIQFSRSALMLLFPQREPSFQQFWAKDRFGSF